MPLTILPCTNCGADLPMQTGAFVQCFACNTTNVYSESLESLNQFVFGLGIQKVIDEIEQKVDEKTINERMIAVDRIFNELLGQSRQIEYVIVSKLDNVDFKIDIKSISCQIGYLNIVMGVYLLPHLSNELQKSQYSEMQSLCKIRNAMLTGLWMTLEGKKAYQVDVAKKWYVEAQLNYARAKEIAITLSSNTSIGFEEEKILSGAAEKYASLLADFLSNNPGYYADGLEQIETQLKDLTDARGTTFKKQIIEIYDLGNTLVFLLEEIRRNKQFATLEIADERVLYYTQEIKDKFDGVKKWIEKLDTKFTSEQKKLMLLHCGKRITYLEDYLKEYQLKRVELISQFNDYISQYVSATISDFALEMADDFELIDLILDDPQFVSEEVVERFEKVKFNVLLLEETVRNFMQDLMKMAIDEDLAQYHSLDLVTSISEKHAIFDKKALRFVTLMIERFVENRNKNRLQIDQQKLLFNSMFLPKIEAVIKESFTLKLEDIPLPIFMEMILLSTSLDVEVDYKVVLIVENPSPITLENVEVTFFVPNSFRIKTRILGVGKLKPGQKLTLDTNIIPTKEGRFNLMAMVNYTHIKESFWMPSITIPLVVGKPDKQDEVLLEIYKKYGVDTKAVDLIKDLENKGSLNPKDADAQADESTETVEKTNLRNMINEVTSIEDSLDEDVDEKTNDD